MTDASSHYEEMKNFMGAKVGMFGVEDREFQRVDNASDCVNDTSGEEPQECAGRKGMPQGPKDTNADPAHCNINYRRKPLGACNPESLDADTYSGDSPYDSQ